jgi:hypothetical protein
MNRERLERLRDLLAAPLPARREATRRLHRAGDTPTTLAARIPGVTPQLIRHDMIALGLWQPTPQGRDPRAPRYRRKTVRVAVAAELALAVQQSAQALDAVAGTSAAEDALLAARAMIRLAMATARQHGLLP